MRIEKQFYEWSKKVVIALMNVFWIDRMWCYKCHKEMGWRNDGSGPWSDTSTWTFACRNRDCAAGGEFFPHGHSYRQFQINGKHKKVNMACK